MSIIAGPLLTSLGINITGALTEAGLSTAISGVIAGGVVSTLSNKIDTAVEGVAKDLLGEQTVESIKETASEKTDLLMRAFYAKHFGNPEYLAQIQPRINKEVNKSVIIDKSPIGSNVQFDTKQLSNLIIENASQMATDYYENGTIDPVKSLEKVVGNDVNKARLAVKLTEFYANKSIPTNDYYNKIASIYNGKNLFYPFVKMKIVDNVKVFYWNDETGQYFEMKQNLGTVLPSLYGVFGGPYSINDELPIDLADSFFCMHDKSAENGILGNIRGDYELVSRLYQNKDRLNQESMPFFNSTIAYFATIASTWLAVKGSIPDDIITTPPDVIITDDFFGYMNSDLAMTDPVEFKVQQHMFYKDLDKSIVDSVASKSIFSAGSSFRNQQLKSDIGNLMVELL